MSGDPVDKRAVVESDADVGEGTRIWHFAHIRGESKIGKNSNIGKDVYIDKYVKIGDNVKIQNGVSIYNGAEIENDVFIGGGVVFTNDKYPRSFNEDYPICRVLVKKGASIGANSVIIGNHEKPLIIGEYVMIGSGSVVTRDIPPFRLAYGNPAKIRGIICICGNKLDNFEGIEGNPSESRYICSNCNKSVQL